MLDADRIPDPPPLARRRWWTPWLQAWTAPSPTRRDWPRVRTRSTSMPARRRRDGPQMLRRIGDSLGRRPTPRRLRGIGACGRKRPIGPATLMAARLADNSLGLPSALDTAWRADTWTPAGRVGLGPIADRRATAHLRVRSRRRSASRDYDYPEPLAGGLLAARLDAAAGCVDRQGPAAADRRRPAAGTSAQVTATWVAPDFVDGPGHLMIGIDPPIGLPMNTVTLNGNIAEASHGETPSRTSHWAMATVAVLPDLHPAALACDLHPERGELAGQAELEIRVNGELWGSAPSFYGRKPTDRIYTRAAVTRREPLLPFGDGRTGARLPCGAINVVARYRKGLGLAGRMKAGQLDVPLERPAGLRRHQPARGRWRGRSRDAGRFPRCRARHRANLRPRRLAARFRIATASGLVARAIPPGSGATRAGRAPHRRGRGRRGLSAAA